MSVCQMSTGQTTWTKRLQHLNEKACHLQIVYVLEFPNPANIDNALPGYALRTSP